MAWPVKFRRIVVDGFKTTLWGHFSTDFQKKGTDGKVFSSPKRRYFILWESVVNSSCGVRSKVTNSRKSARFIGRSAAAARRRAKEQPFSVVMATRIALHSMDEVTRKTMPIDSRKNELRSCSTDRERSRFVLESRHLAFLRVLPCISDVWRAFSPRFSRLDAHWIELCIAVFIVVIGRMCCGDIAFSVGDHRQSWCIPIV